MSRIFCALAFVLSGIQQPASQPASTARRCYPSIHGHQTRGGQFIDVGIVDVRER